MSRKRQALEARALPRATLPQLCPFAKRIKMKYAIFIMALLTIGCSRKEGVPVPPRVLMFTNASPIVVVSDAAPDPYTHPTTHPASQLKELDLDLNMGHWDGGTTVGFVGKVVQVKEDGSIAPIPHVRFFQLNDKVLLREARHTLLPFTTDTNGNFRTMLEVFAAFGCRKGTTNDWAVYQTGTTTIGAQAGGFEMRRINVRFQQPSTLIVLKKRQ
ncbi:MAG: hypothetical protein HYV36_02725 [Lentisphaerae bacterium]|nr:hypothetical protein [Lentisphaerota bacterium]